MPSASLVPPRYDPSVLLTTAGMQPFKPYFRGEEEPPSRRLTSCQKCFRTTDIENVGTTTRHLTFFEMLGNFSVGDYFKQGAVEFAWELSTQGFGFDPERIWITVFGGDDELGLGPDEEAIACWRAIGVPDERIVQPRPRRQLLAVRARPGPAGPARSSTSTAVPPSAADDDRPGDDTERYLEYWNLVFMQYELHAGRLADRAAHAEHRHGHGARADGGDPAGRAVGLRDGPVPAARRARRGALGPTYGRGRAPTTRALRDARRPRPRR